MTAELIVLFPQIFPTSILTTIKECLACCIPLWLKVASGVCSIFPFLMFPLLREHFQKMRSAQFSNSFQRDVAECHSFCSLKIRPEWGIPASRWEQLYTGGSEGGQTCPFATRTQQGLSILALHVSPMLMIIVSIRSSQWKHNIIFLLTSPFPLPPHISILHSLILILAELESTYWEKYMALQIHVQFPSLWKVNYRLYSIKI